MGTKVSGVVNWTKTMHTSSQEIARTVRRFPLSQRVDIFWLKRDKGLPWDGQGLVRRGRPPKLVLPEPSVAETGETLRTGGASSSDPRREVDMDAKWKSVKATFQKSAPRWS